MYSIRYDGRALEDFERGGSRTKKKIKRAIESKLTTQPEIFGKPLRQSLAGFRVLRVENYRIVFLLKKAEVLIFLIGNREHVYKQAQRRFE